MQYFNIQPYGSGGNKSSSFPNFYTASLTNFQRSASREMMQQHHQQQFNQQLTAPTSHHNNQAPPYHRHSLNNLMPFNSPQQLFMNRRNSSCGSDRSMMGAHTTPSPLGSHEKNLSDSGLSICTSTSLNSTAPTASDINSRLESLCRQMTEQAIN